MVVQHNLQAMNASRMLGITTRNVSNATEKLSSGYRINRAADDAAGLAISEKMRKQIRGLGRASANAEDGISCVQTAEGALAEVQDMLQRMNELCVQAANGTNSVIDRQYIQDEIDQLISEVDRVAETTKFNDMYLLKGDEEKEARIIYITNYSITYTRNIVSNAQGENALPYKVNYTGNNNIYIISNDIFSASFGDPMTADKIQKGDDITQYMAYLDSDNKADATLDVSKYASFINVGLNSVVLDGKNGLVNSELPTSSSISKYMYDLSTNGIDDTVRANRELYVYDTKTSNITRVCVGNEMTDFLNQDNTMNDRYRLVDILSASKDKVASAAGISGISNTTMEIVRYTGNSGTAFYVDENNPSNISTIQLKKGQDITKLYYENANNSWAYVPVKSAIESGDLFGQYITGVYQQSFTYYENNIKYISEPLGPFIATMPPTFTNRATGIDGSTRRFRSTTIANAYDGNAFVVEPASAISKSTFPTSGTSQRVMESVLGGEAFSWTDKDVEIDTSLQKLYDADGNEVSAVALHKYFDENGKYKGGLFSTSQARAIDEVFANTNSQAYKNIAAGGITPLCIETYITQSSTQVNGDLDFTLHVGADSDRTNKIDVDVKSLTAAGLGIDKLASYNIGIVDTTGNNATDAIDVIAEALTKISIQRSSLGATQNRLDHTIKNLDNVVENTTASESKIRDTDMAEEMVRYTNNNILQQAGQSMLAQTNQSNQGVLSLLQ